MGVGSATHRRPCGHGRLQRRGPVRDRCQRSLSSMVRIIAMPWHFHALVQGSLKAPAEQKRRSSMPGIRRLNVSTSASLSRQASHDAARTIHQETANPAAASDTARPGRITASPSRSLSRHPRRVRGGTWQADSTRDNRPHSPTWQYQRYFLHTTSIRPATGMNPEPLEAAFLSARGYHPKVGVLRIKAGTLPGRHGPTTARAHPVKHSIGTWRCGRHDTARSRPRSKVSAVLTARFGARLDCRTTTKWAQLIGDPPGSCFE